MGNKAVFTIGSSSGYWMKVYRSSERDCKDCPFHKECIGEKTKFKKIDDSIHKPLYDRMHQRLQTAKAKRMKKLRSSTVEPVLGTLINFGGMRRYKPRKAKVAAKAGELPQDARNNVQNKLILPLFCSHSL